MLSYAAMVRRLIRAGMDPHNAIELVVSTYRVSRSELMTELGAPS